MSLELYAAYLVACFIIVIVPGPTVTLIVANSLRYGARAGLTNVAGTQLGLGVIIAVVGIGLDPRSRRWAIGSTGCGSSERPISSVWLGWRMFRASDGLDAAQTSALPRGGFLAQGLLVALSNPKTLLFFGAFFPQLIDPRGDHALQIVIMGLTALAFAAVSDSAYALLSGRAGRLLSRHRVRLLSRLSRGFLIGGGLWLAFTRAR